MGDCALSLDQVVDRVAVIGLVGEHGGARREMVQQHIGRATVGDLAAGQQEAERSAFAIGERVRFMTNADGDNDVARCKALGGIVLTGMYISQLTRFARRVIERMPLLLVPQAFGSVARIAIRTLHRLVWRPVASGARGMLPEAQCERDREITARKGHQANAQCPHGECGI